MPPFDDREYAEAFQPPSVILGGRTFVGVVISAEEWFGNIMPRLAEIPDDATRAQLTPLFRELTDLSFPSPWWKLWQPRVWTLLSRLPWGAQQEAVAGFTAALHLAHLGRMTGPSSASPSAHAANSSG